MQQTVDEGRFAQSTIDALSAHLCVLDETGTILATNAAWRRFAEANPPMARRAQVGTNYLHVCDAANGPEAADASYFASAIRAALSGEHLDFEMEYACHSPSEQRWFIGRVTRFPDDGPARVVVAHENITKRKEAEITARRLAAIIESSDDAIIGKDLDSIVTSWNQGAVKIFGYTVSEMVGTSIMRLIPADRQDEEVHILGRIRRGERVEHFETQRRTKDGRLIDVSVTASPIKDAAGTIIGASKVARDITSRKRVEAEQQATEERYRTLFDYAPDGIVVANRESYYLDANVSMCRMLGYDRNEFIGLHASDIVAPAEIPHIGAALSEISATSDHHREWLFRRKDGSVFPAEVIATTMPDGNLLGIETRDETDRTKDNKSEHHHRPPLSRMSHPTLLPSK